MFLKLIKIIKWSIGAYIFWFLSYINYLIFSNILPTDDNFFDLNRLLNLVISSAISITIVYLIWNKSKSFWYRIQTFAESIEPQHTWNWRKRINKICKLLIFIVIFCFVFGTIFICLSMKINYSEYTVEFCKEHNCIPVGRKIINTLYEFFEGIIVIFVFIISISFLERLIEVIYWNRKALNEFKIEKYNTFQKNKPILMENVQLKNRHYKNSIISWFSDGFNKDRDKM